LLYYAGPATIATLEALGLLQIGDRITLTVDAPAQVRSGEVATLSIVMDNEEDEYLEACCTSTWAVAYTRRGEEVQAPITKCRERPRTCFM
jgi:hypothetical protein